jgi:O-antigen/teichoic acid export membrane protein
MWVSISAVIYERIDQVMLKSMINDYSVGIYSASVKISGLFTSLSPVFAYSFFPALINSKKESNEKLEKRLVYLYSFTFWFTLFLSTIVWRFSKEIVIIIYGNKFVDSYGAAIASLISFGFAAYIYNIFFKKTRLNFKLQTVGALLPFYYLFKNLRR